MSHLAADTVSKKKLHYSGLRRVILCVLNKSRERKSAVGLEPKMQIHGKAIQMWLSREEAILSALRGTH